MFLVYIKIFLVYISQRYHSKRSLSKSEISLLSKGLKFVPTSTIIDQAKLKAELEIFGRKFRLKWYFRNNEESIQENRFKTKPKFNPRNKDAAIEIYLDLSDVYTCFKVTGIQFAERKLVGKGTCECSNLPQRYFIERHTSHSTYTAPFRCAGGCAKAETKWK